MNNNKLILTRMKNENVVECSEIFLFDIFIRITRFMKHIKRIKCNARQQKSSTLLAKILLKIQYSAIHLYIIIIVYILKPWRHHDTIVILFVLAFHIR